MVSIRAETSSAGFTLLEAMVALVIVALGMMAVNTQLNRYAAASVFAEEKTLASWIATNKITELSVAGTWPELGDSDEEVDFAGRLWQCRVEVDETPVENLRRVDVSIALADDPERVVHKVSGLVEPPAPRGFLPLRWIGPAPDDGRGRPRRDDDDRPRPRRKRRTPRRRKRSAASGRKPVAAARGRTMSPRAAARMRVDPRIHADRAARRDGDRRGDRHHGAWRIERGHQSADDRARARRALAAHSARDADGCARFGAVAPARDARGARRGIAAELARGTRCAVRVGVQPRRLGESGIVPARLCSACGLRLGGRQARAASIGRSWIER